MARGNAADLGLAARVTFLHGDWFDALEGDHRFDVIVSNPPYISPAELAELPADVRDWEPHSALFADDDGLADLRRIVEGAPRWLMAGGLLALELAETRATAVAAWDSIPAPATASVTYKTVAHHMPLSIAESITA